MVVILFSLEEQQQEEEEEAVFMGFIEVPNILTYKQKPTKIKHRDREGRLEGRKQTSKGVK